MPIEKVKGDVGTRGIGLGSGETPDEAARKIATALDRETNPVLRELRRRFNELTDLYNSTESVVNRLVEAFGGSPSEFVDQVNELSQVSLYESVYAVDFTLEDDQDVDGEGNLTIGGNTWYGRNLAQAGTARLVKGQGVIIDTTGGSGGTNIEFWAASTDGPRFEVNLEDLYSFRWDDSVRIQADVDVEFTGGSAGFSFAGIIIAPVAVEDAGVGTALPHSGQMLRGNDSSGVEETRIRSTSNSTGDEDNFIREDVDDRGSCSISLDWVKGEYFGRVADPFNEYTGWPIGEDWEWAGVARPFQVGQGGVTDFQAGGSPSFHFKMRGMLYAGRSVSSSEQARITFKRLEVFVRRGASLATTQLPLTPVVLGSESA